MYRVCAFYRFTPLDDVPSLCANIRLFSKKTPTLCGTILLAPEGVNATIGAHSADLEKMIDFLDAKLGIRHGELKYSQATQKPFNRFKVRPKKEIITMRHPEADPNKQVGQYVEAQDWNDLLADPDIVLIDTRNDYETDVGIFKSAIDPRLKTFGEFPAWVEQHLNPVQHKKIAMFCTGGIRCEKASSYMLTQGFEEVYHLRGGILKYLETVPVEQSLWEGECFVFDKRVAVGNGLVESGHKMCYGCRYPLAEDEINNADFEEGVSCSRCKPNLTTARAQALRRRHKEFSKKTSQTLV